ncbi:NEL-type E3 ubiquitin ligase domain-containing protein [Pseudomonas sp. EMN2]|uniref:NEL-type E3 ubiquitin ligase domain-containing protein n=1 Tax=Pseudomonas sp. EMN2 TaxID=2615212 RepID=UPI00129B79F4|nr:NEL-type E3 ubiquitin ligase domain-containing protein [Pseudomonas sp. EMN2]
MPHSFPSPVSNDALLAQTLPAWLTRASTAHRRALCQGLQAQQRAQHALDQQLGALLAIDAFAEPLLVEALQDASGLALDVRACRLLRVWTEVQPVVPASLPLPIITHQHTHSLLAAALHNFSESEAQAGGLGIESRLLDGAGNPLALAASTFAALCRRLDLGGRYQAYLKQRLRPADAPGEAGGYARIVVNRLMEEQLRASLEVAVRLAHLQGDIDDTAYLRWLPQFSAQPIVATTAEVLHLRQLHLLGHPLHGVAAYEVRHGVDTVGVMAWLPDDPKGAVLSADTWDALYRILGQRLRDPGYARYLQRFIGETERVAFGLALDARLQADRDAPALRLDGRAREVEGELLAYLRQVQVQRLLDDARVLAVPIDDEDRERRNERLQGYLNAGLDLLGLAALFVPGLGEALLGIAALQVVHEAYEGYEAWQLGDREAALGHLFGIAEGLAQGALSTGSEQLLGALLERSAFVDGLRPVVTGRGRVKLCDGALSDYRLSDDGHVAGRLVGEGDRRSLTLHEGRYAVVREGPGEPWHISHPRRAGAHVPRLESNGMDGWWHALEAPQRWVSPVQLLRRLGGDFMEVTQAQAQALLEVTGFDVERLRRLLLEQAEPPARLLDSLERLVLRDRWPALSAQALQHGLASDLPALAGESVLRRDFPNLSRRAAQALLRRATGAELHTLRTSRKVPLALAEEARWQMRDSRLDQACEGVLHGRSLNQDSERLTLALLDHLAPWPADVRVEIRDALPGGTLLAHCGPASGHKRLILKRPEGYLAAGPAGQGLAGASPDDSLLQALSRHLPAAQKSLLGDQAATPQALGHYLVQQAAVRRDQAAGWIGMSVAGTGVRPPVRWGDGRLGYPLSGRGGSSRQALEQGIRQVFPTLDDAQLQAYINERLLAGDNLWSHMSALHQQLQRLQSALAAWQRSAGDAQQAQTRHRIAARLLRCWRRQSPVVQGGYRLVLEGESLQVLPALPAGLEFAHVHYLALHRLELGEVAGDWLRRFPALRRLDLSDNRLVVLPDALGELSHLAELNVSGNLIRWSDQANLAIGRLNLLEVLNVNRNPLEQMPTLASLTRLRQVHLRATGLTQVPQSLPRLGGLEYADLRDNLIVDLDSTLFELPRGRLEHIALHDNPLSAASLARLESFLQGGRGPLRRLLRHFRPEEGARDVWLEGLDRSQRAIRLGQWDNVAQQSGSSGLLRLLGDLRGTADFRSQRAELRQRVWRVVEACEQDGQLRQALFELAARPRSCSDSVALNFSHLEVLALVHQRTHGVTGVGAERDLLRLGRDLFRLDEVERLATLDIESRWDSGAFVDDVEVRLAYRVGLAEPLNLPAQPEGMRYASSADVTAQQLSQVRAQVLGAERGPRLLESLTQREFWQAHLRATYGEQFEATDQPFHQRLEALLEATDDLTDAEYLAAIDQVAQAREQAQRALIFELTRSAWQRHPG